MPDILIGMLRALPLFKIAIACDNHNYLLSIIVAVPPAASIACFAEAENA
jgi:hypothetical protein